MVCVFYWNLNDMARLIYSICSLDLAQDKSRRIKLMSGLEMKYLGYFLTGGRLFKKKRRERGSSRSGHK